VVDPRMREDFVLLRKDRFEAMQTWVASLKRRWDNPGGDEIAAQEKLVNQLYEVQKAGKTP